jgi:leucyl aminopeptidase
MARGNFVARDIVGAPSNVKNPVALAELASEFASKWGLELNVLTEEACRQLGMGAYLGVAQGSRYPPQFMHFTYRPASGRATKKVVLIGKTMTFDSGGYNLKVGVRVRRLRRLLCNPYDHLSLKYFVAQDSMIEKMKMDVGGGAAVLGAAKILSELQPQVEVHFILPACENMISDRSYRPGDIITASNGRTIEVDNTDAEGRLTLADALVYGEKLKPDAMFTIATLTGAIIVALGDNVAGFFTGHPDLKHKLEQAAQATKEPVWHMPMVARCKETLKSSIADMVNSGKTRSAGSITAAQFLQDFVDTTPYAHVDIAGTAMDMKAGVATGYGARLLAQLVLTFDGHK